MEKIKEALAKVKLNKQSLSDDTSSSKKLGRRRKKEESVAEVKADIGHIDYTTSTVVKLDEKHLEDNRIVMHLTNNADASIFDSLRTQVLQRMEENNWKTLAITSPVAESGKTVISTNLAISMSHQPQKTTVLADFDLRRPKVATYLGLNQKQSLNEYLNNDAELSEIMVNPGMQRLIVLPTMKPVPGSANVLSSSKVSGLIDELRNRYESRITIVDLPPMLGADDAMVLLPHVDCVLLVVANGVSTQEEIEDTLHLLPKEKLLGVVYNKADAEKKAYYY